MQLAKKWPEIAVKQPFIIVIRFDSDYNWLAGEPFKNGLIFFKNVKQKGTAYLLF